MQQHVRDVHLESSNTSTGGTDVAIDIDDIDQKPGVYLGFIHTEASADDSFFKLAVLPVLYRGPGLPASIVGEYFVHYKAAVSAPVRDDKGNVTGDNGPWLLRMFFTLFEVIFPNIVALARKTRNEKVAGPMSQILNAVPGIRFIVCDELVSVAALNDILTAERVPIVSPLVFSQIREYFGVLPGPGELRSSASVSLDGLPQQRNADLVQVFRLAQQFLDFMDPHVAAAAASAAAPDALP